MRVRPLTAETRDLIRQDWRRMRHDADTVRTICQLHAATKAQVLEALGDLYDPAEVQGRKRGVRTPAELAVLAKVDAGEMSFNDAADELHVEPNTVRVWLKKYQAERAAQAGAACIDPEKTHEPDRAEESFPAPETAPAGPHVESIVDNIRTYIAELEGAFLELSRYGLISEQAADACLQGIRLKAEGFIAGLRWRGISDAGQSTEP